MNYIKINYNKRLIRLYVGGGGVSSSRSSSNSSIVIIIIIKNDSNFSMKEYVFPTTVSRD